VESFGDANMFPQQYVYPHEDDMDVIDVLLGYPDRQKYILQPADIMRLDGQ